MPLCLLFISLADFDALGVGSRVRIHEIERVVHCEVTDARKLPDIVVGSLLVGNNRCSRQDVDSNDGIRVGALSKIEIGLNNSHGTNIRSPISSDAHC